MSHENKTDAIRYLTKWFGFILFTLILSGFGYCSFKSYITPLPEPQTCESEVIDTVEFCMKLGTESIECMNKGIELLKACNESSE